MPILDHINPRAPQARSLFLRQLTSTCRSTWTPPLERILDGHTTLLQLSAIHTPSSPSKSDPFVLSRTRSLSSLAHRYGNPALLRRSLLPLQR